MFTWSEDVKSLPGPVGVKYDDSMTVLKIHLVVMGIKEKTIIRAANTDVHLKYNEEGFSVLLEVFKLNKKTKPPMKKVLEKRFFEMRKCPSKILSVDYKLKNDQCILSIRKALPGLWSNALSL
ncbi:Uncharacterized protein BM_BM7100 [Brugia malayi]|uniref:Bm7100 n=2 Tax=Brugia malayi TaxID=6279 RepID=A0A5S6PU46_BRUMA|nr:Uncharacterized protein BM_BM7100 [Brugia malayi]VIO91804.1 Uncharacterized protein BM_BM7100 [Brugia malayi]